MITGNQNRGSRYLAVAATGRMGRTCQRAADGSRVPGRPPLGRARLPLRRNGVEQPHRKKIGPGIHAPPPRATQERKKRFLTPLFHPPRRTTAVFTPPLAKPLSQTDRKRTGACGANTSRTTRPSSISCMRSCTFMRRPWRKKRLRPAGHATANGRSGYGAARSTSCWQRSKRVSRSSACLKQKNKERRGLKSRNPGGT